MQETVPKQPALSLEERNRLAANEARFFEPNRELLMHLFNALGVAGQWSDDPRDIIDYIRRRWIGTEHGDGGGKAQFNAAQVESAMPFLEGMGFVQETVPPAGDYDYVIVLGGTMQANMRRGRVVRDALASGRITARQVTFWAGQRPREVDRRINGRDIKGRDGSTEEILNFASGRFSGLDTSQNPWLNKLIARHGLDPANPWGFSETDSARLAVLRLFGGDLATRRVPLDVITLNVPMSEQIPLPPRRPTMPARVARSYEYVTGEGQKIVVMNAQAVNRESGSPRHTTRSCAEEWIRDQLPPREEGRTRRVLFVSSNPHTIRTAQDVIKVLRECGRDDVELVIAGASAPENASIQLFLGEVGRLVDKDVQAHYPPKPQSERVENSVDQPREWRLLPILRRLRLS